MSFRSRRAEELCRASAVWESRDTCYSACRFCSRSATSANAGRTDQLDKSQIYGLLPFLSYLPGLIDRVNSCVNCCVASVEAHRQGGTRNCRLAIGLKVTPMPHESVCLSHTTESVTSHPMLRLQANIQCLPGISSFRRRPLNER